MSSMALVQPIIDLEVSHTLLWHMEYAGQAYLSRNLDSLTNKWLPFTQIYRGAENRDVESMEGEDSSVKKRPCVIITCNSQDTMLHPFVGLWHGLYTIGVEVNRAKETGDSADQKAGEVFDLFLTPTIKQDLCAMIDGMQVQGMIPQGVTRRADGRGWVFELHFQLEHVRRKS